MTRGLPPFDPVRPGTAVGGRDVVVVEVERRRTEFGAPWLVLRVLHEGESWRAVAFPALVRRSALVNEGDVLHITGRLAHRDGEDVVVVEKMHPAVRDAG